MSGRRKYCPRGATAAERVMYYARIDDAGCWIWTGTVGKAGYGWVRHEGRPSSAHRFSYETFVGPIPDGLHLDHLCRNRACVNPDHLEPVTPHVNIVVRGAGPTALNAAKTHCLRGHELTPENTYVSRKGRSRACRTCALDRHRAKKQARAS